MMKKIFTILVLWSVPVVTMAAAIDDSIGKIGKAADKAGLGATRTPAELVSSFINIAISILGVIAVILVIYAGGMWLTAAGNGSKVDQAKQIIQTTVIGIVIVGLAYAITTFVLNFVLKSALV